MNSTKATRAPKGGTTGMNGEQYAGGTFLPNTTLGKMGRGSKGTGSRKQQVAPFVWEVAPADGMMSLYGRFNHLVDWRSEQVIVSGCQYFGNDVVTVAKMLAAWKAGIRWTAR